VKLVGAIGLAMACVSATHPVYHPEVVQLVGTDSDKAVQIVSDERLAAHEPRAVAATALVAALIASGMFLEEDARQLAAPIAACMATMQPDEAVRIIGWAADAPRYYYVFVHGDRLQVTYYAGGQHQDDYSAVIPADATPIVGPVAPSLHVDPPPVPPDAGAAPPPPAPPVSGADQIATQPRARRTHAAPAAYQPITEQEARRRMRELDDARQAGLITEAEHRTKRKEILSRL
jgi:hypothetical protein